MHRLRKQHDLKLLGTGQATVPSGKDLKDTYIKMLSSLRGVTEAIAKGIVGEYPTFRSLLDAWETCEGGEKGKQSMLVGIGVSLFPRLLSTCLRGANRSWLRSPEREERQRYCYSSSDRSSSFCKHLSNDD